MKIEVEVKTLPQAFRILMAARNKTYRDLAAETGITLSAVWRFAKRPEACSARMFVPLVRWMRITEGELWDLWDAHIQDIQSSL